MLHRSSLRPARFLLNELDCDPLSVADDPGYWVAMNQGLDDVKKRHTNTTLDSVDVLFWRMLRRAFVTGGCPLMGLDKFCRSLLDRESPEKPALVVPEKIYPSFDIFHHKFRSLTYV
jgi:hypothetical protein